MKGKQRIAGDRLVAKRLKVEAEKQANGILLLSRPIEPNLTVNRQVTVDKPVKTKLKKALVIAGVKASDKKFGAPQEAVDAKRPDKTISLQSLVQSQLKLAALLRTPSFKNIDLDGGGLGKIIQVDHRPTHCNGFSSAHRAVASSAQSSRQAKMLKRVHQSLCALGIDKRAILRLD